MFVTAVCALCPSSKFCRNYCCEILLGICRSPKRISQLYFMHNLGSNKVHYGELENRECLLRYATKKKRELAGMQRDKAPVEWPRQRRGTHWGIGAWTGTMETNAIAFHLHNHTGRGHWIRKQGKQVDEGLGDSKMRAGTTKQTTCTGQTGNRARQQDRSVQRQR